MKVQLYAVGVGSVWRWHLTIHTQTDIHYWFEYYAADAGLVMLEPFVSLGQGVRLLQLLNVDDQLVKMGGFPQKIEWIRKLAVSCAIPLGALESMGLKLLNYDVWKQRMDTNTSPIHPGIYEKVVRACKGRALLNDEIQQLLESSGVQLGSGDEWLPYLQLAHLNGDIELTNGLQTLAQRDWRRGFKRVTSYTCKRCGSGAERMFWSPCIHCGQECPYCEECLTMGRARFCSLLVLGRSGTTKSEHLTDGSKAANPSKLRVSQVQSVVNEPDEILSYVTPWGLSDAQTAASLEGLNYLRRDGETEGKWKQAKLIVKGENCHEPRKFLIWAVTGAGKTEMIFPFIHYTITNGGRVLIATPRKDVVLELQPRIKKAFSPYSVVTLYGGSEQRWEQGQITIATTHQLLRFHEAFDLVIIDEIDAFPYHNNPMLGFAAAKVCKPNGTNILLSATPPKAIRQAADRGRLPHVRVPVRFHRHPLPVPLLVAVPPLRNILQTQKFPSSLLSKLVASVERGAQVFVFVPNISLVEPAVELLRLKMRDMETGATICIEGTSSKDAERTEKVQRFRDRDIRLLVTTTILERGVTVPKSDVFIIDADSKLFDEAALVQMAGRAGRSKDDPAGKVYFAAKEITQSQKEAIRQIKQMNRIARKQGYLIKGGNE
ncbi:DEAD/DEAH box helicase [Paenibacillus sp. N3.4]|uniref:DEAD/DEAH box helicase n=1 Tax=Paenibacillus sp. N3.4 TaxID=2603222 RepID=UPI0011CBB013|nr:helicase-related protein [Paenibacillus sp. N3.4]TXK80956.1 DEAD/DEAH box helicase [Paenibacillus sp. N3.4]